MNRHMVVKLDFVDQNTHLPVSFLVSWLTTVLKGVRGAVFIPKT